MVQFARQHNVIAFRPLRCCYKHVLSHVGIIPNGSTTVLVRVDQRGSRSVTTSKRREVRFQLHLRCRTSAFVYCCPHSETLEWGPTVEVLMFAPCARCTHDRVQTLRVLGHHLLKLRNALCAPKHHHLHLSRKRNRKLHGQIVATTHKG